MGPRDSRLGETTPPGWLQRPWEGDEALARHSKAILSNFPEIFRQTRNSPDLWEVKDTSSHRQSGGQEGHKIRSNQLKSWLYSRETLLYDNLADARINTDTVKQ